MSTEAPDNRDLREPTRFQSLLFGCGALVILGFLVVFMVSAFKASSGTSAVKQLTSGEETPAPQLPTEGDGAEVPDFAAVRAGTESLDGPVIVNFWASWCGPCREEMPELVALSTNWKAAGVTVVGVNAQDLRSDAKAFLEEYDVTYPNVYATTENEEAWGTRGFPETFIVDGNGMVAGHIPGPVDQATLEPILKELGA